MITKERIDELIQQRAKVWGVGKQGNVFCVGLKFRPETLKDKKWLENKYEFYGKFFETKAEAEWHAEFGCIERTARLELPSWEEFIEMSSFIFENKDGIDLEMAIWYCDREDLQIKTIKITNFNNWNIRLFEQPLTKENYTLACRKCKELFLGEKE